jgi:hypothetical protein
MGSHQIDVWLPVPPLVFAAFLMIVSFFVYLWVYKLLRSLFMGD